MDSWQEYFSNYKRRVKGLTQRILLIGGTKYNEGYLTCQILGSSNNVYTITITCQKRSVWACCNCPDSIIRDATCKHLYWFGHKILGFRDPAEWTCEAIELFAESFTNSAIHGRNETCPICLEDIHYDKEYTLCCVQSCQNAVHALCWKRYHFASYSTKCVICRSSTMPSVM
jgi:hypothetical protein